MVDAGPLASCMNARGSISEDGSIGIITRIDPNQKLSAAL